MVPEFTCSWDWLLLVASVMMVMIRRSSPSLLASSRSLFDTASWAREAATTCGSLRILYKRPGDGNGWIFGVSAETCAFGESALRLTRCTPSMSIPSKHSVEAAPSSILNPAGNAGLGLDFVPRRCNWCFARGQEQKAQNSPNVHDLLDLPPSSLLRREYQHAVPSLKCDSASCDGRHL